MVQKVQQQFKDRCDVNKIIKKYSRTGVLALNSGVAKFGDFTNIGDFHAVQNRIVEATQAFMALPAHVRSLFKNDVGECLSYVAEASVDWKSKKAQEARELGLLPALTKDQLEILESEKAAPVKPDAEPPTGGV